MCDYINQADIRRKALAEMIQISEEAGLYEEQASLFETIDVGPVKITGYPAAFVNLLSDEVDRLNAVIARVRKLHIQETPIAEFCEECLAIYPCPTIKALDGEQ